MHEKPAQNEHIEGVFRGTKFLIQKSDKGDWSLTTTEPVSDNNFIYLNYFTNRDGDEGVIIGTVYPGQWRALLLGSRGGIQFRTEEELKKMNKGLTAGFNGPRFEYK